MTDEPQLPEMTITLHTEAREDGGLRIWSNDVPGLVLSHSDPSAVWRDLGPSIEMLIRINRARESRLKAKATHSETAPSALEER